MPGGWQERAWTSVLEPKSLGSVPTLPRGGSLAQSPYLTSRRASTPATQLSLGFRDCEPWLAILILQVCSQGKGDEHAKGPV